jgi:predicted nucleotidyltransferase
MVNEQITSQFHVVVPPEKELQRLSRTFHLRLMVLFGSSARGRSRPDSDLDIGVLVGDNLSAARRTKLWGMLCRLFQAEVDLTVLNHSDPLLGYQVACEGIVLFETEPDAWETWKSYAMRRFWDTEKFRQALKGYVTRRAEDMRHAIAE